jgi:hypothetical protein
MTRVLSLTTTDWRSFYESQLTALEQAGVEVTTLTVPGEHRARTDAVTRRTYAEYTRYLPQVLRESRRGYDLVHANYGLSAPFAAAASALPGADLPVVCTLWGGEFIDNPYTPIIEPFASRADRVIVPSQAMADRIDLACDVVPFPVDMDRLADVLNGDRRADGRAQIVDYTVEKMAARLRDVYTDCLDRLDSPQRSRPPSRSTDSLD